MTTGYYCAIFPFRGGGKKKENKKTNAFYDWATTGIPVIMSDFVYLYRTKQTCMRHVFHRPIYGTIPCAFNGTSSVCFLQISREL